MSDAPTEQCCAGKEECHDKKEQEACCGPNGECCKEKCGDKCECKDCKCCAGHEHTEAPAQEAQEAS